MSYNGGKSGSGTYQALINQIPPHKVRYSVFAGHCGISRKMKPATFNFLSDLDSAVIDYWNGLSIMNFSATVEDALEVLHQLPKRIAALNAVSKDVFLPDDVFVFLDPPYPVSVRKSKKNLYAHEFMGDAQHSVLLNLITSDELRGYKIMICSYQNDLYDAVLDGWRFIDYSNQTRHGVVTERCYMNYTLEGKLHDYSFIGKDYRQREHYARVKARLLARLNSLDEFLKNSIINDLLQ